MAMIQNGVSSSYLLILVGAGLTGSVILRNGQLFDAISQLQELLKGVNKVESGKYDSDPLAFQLRRLTQEIRELTLSRPVTILNENSDTSGNFTSYLVPAAAVGVMGYCYMWWKGWPISDVMFVTKQNMANVVANVSKQLEQVSTVIASTKRHLTERLENVNGKLDEQKESSKLIMNEVVQVRSDISEIGFDIELIQKMIFGLEGKLELLENKQDITNSGIWHLCQFAGSIKDGFSSNLLQDSNTKHIENSSANHFENNSLKGLQFLAETIESGEGGKLKMNTVLQNEPFDTAKTKIGLTAKTIIHKSWSRPRPVGISIIGGEHGLES